MSSEPHVEAAEGSHHVGIFDGHNDSLTRVHAATPEARRAFVHGSDEGDLDLPRARTGGFLGGMFAIQTASDPAGRIASFVASEQLDDDDVGFLPTDRSFYLPVDGSFAQRYAVSVIAGLLRLERQFADEFTLVHDVAELNAAFQTGRIGAVLHFEGAEPIDPQLNSLEVFFSAGLRSLGLVWSRPNLFAQGVPFRFPGSPDTGPGLTTPGKDLVRACNELGIVVDLSHLNAKGFWDVADISDAPLVATHSNAHALCASTRNLLDEQLTAIAESDGIVGVNFSANFLREDGAPHNKASMSDLVSHFVYLVERMGIEHVGFGADFDGAWIPEEVADVAGLQKVIQALRREGFTEEDLVKLARDNWLRVLGATWH